MSVQVESEIKRKNTGITFCSSSDHGNCSSHQYFPVTYGAGKICNVPCRCCMLILGMGFFQLGAEIAMTPLGEGIGVE